VSRHKEFDVSKALHAAQDAFWDRGYASTSVDDLARQTGVRKASLYATFGPKNRLFLSALRQYQDETYQVLRQALEEPKSARDALHLMFRAIVHDSCTERGRRGCLSVNSCVELAPHDPAVAAEIRRQRRRVEALLAATIRRGIEAGEFAPTLRPASVARFLGSSMLGLSVIAKTVPGRKALAEIAQVTLSVLDP
jgi:TetR/AcrR family transcriptional repressor of nem operon